jgi:hypothetical protein
MPSAGCMEREVPDQKDELLLIGDDWAEDHVRHEALEVERG